MNYILLSKCTIIYFILNFKWSLIKPVTSSDISGANTQNPTFSDTNYTTGSFTDPNTYQTTIIPLPSNTNQISSLQQTQSTNPSVAIPLYSAAIPAAQTVSIASNPSQSVQITTQQTTTTSPFTQNTTSTKLPTSVNLSDLITVNLSVLKSTEEIEYQLIDGYKHVFTAKGNLYIKEGVYNRTDPNTGTIEKKTIWSPKREYAKRFVFETPAGDKPTLNVVYESDLKQNLTTHNQETQHQTQNILNKQSTTQTSEVKTETTQQLNVTQQNIHQTHLSSSYSFSDPDQLPYEPTNQNQTSHQTSHQPIQHQTLQHTTAHQTSHHPIANQTLQHTTAHQTSHHPITPTSEIEPTTSFSDPTNFSYVPITSQNQQSYTGQIPKTTTDTDNQTQIQTSIVKQETNQITNKETSIDYKEDYSKKLNQTQDETENKIKIDSKGQKYLDIKIDHDDDDNDYDEQEDNQQTNYQVKEIYNYDHDDDNYDRIPLTDYITDLGHRVVSLEIRMDPVEEKIELLSKVIQYQKHIMELNNLLKTKKYEIIQDLNQKPFKSYKFKPATSKISKNLEQSEYPSDIKLYDEVGVKMEEMNKTKYIVKQEGDVIYYEWESNVKCVWVTYKEKSVWSYIHGNYPLRMEFHPEEEKVVVDFNDAIIMYIKKEETNKTNNINEADTINNEKNSIEIQLN